MYKIEVSNVNEALPLAIMHLVQYGEEVTSRGIKTIEIPGMFVTTYLNPTERVIFSPTRDANPFFHLMESLWILAGRNDVEWLAQFNAKMKDYSDDGETFHAPYGYRLRNHFRNKTAKGAIDQIQTAIDMLKKDPDTRQCVLQIWDCRKDLDVKSKDIPCNDLVFLKIRKGKLNMTVCCRSNDAIWGAYGANVVQFSMLQEYIAGMVGVQVGVYNQVSDSLHVYPDNPKWELLKECYTEDFNNDLYRYKVAPTPIMIDPDSWDCDLETFFNATRDLTIYELGNDQVEFSNTWFSEVAIPMFQAWRLYKAGGKNKNEAIDVCGSIMADDWGLACKEWVERRL